MSAEREESNEHKKSQSSERLGRRGEHILPCGDMLEGRHPAYAGLAHEGAPRHIARLAHIHVRVRDAEKTCRQEAGRRENDQNPLNCEL